MNYLGEDERSITIIQNHHRIAKIHRYTTMPTKMTTTLNLYKQFNVKKYQSSSTTRIYQFHNDIS